MKSALFLRTAVVLGLAALTGCATTPGAPGARFVVVVPKAPLYKYGPAQSFGPDFTLPKGMKVTMLEQTFGFARVMTDQGLSGFVASEELKPAPPEPRTPPLKFAKPGGGRGVMYSGKIKRTNLDGVPGEPLFNVNDVPQPLPDAGAQKVKPKFRF